MLINNVKKVGIALYTLSVMIFGGSNLNLIAQTEEVDSFKELHMLTIEELMQIKVTSPANFTNLKTMHTPAFITTITRDDIINTPARNIYDLIEVYVPGAMWLNHTEGPKIGIRGIISDRNYKYLILLNGRVINDKTKLGAKAELETWDLGDIEKIEIISGPGSVVHGPGAVGGVISITTTSYEEKQLTLNSDYNPIYGMKGVSAGYSHTYKNLSLNSYAGIYDCKGYQNPDYYVPDPNSNSLYYGKNESDNFHIPSYFAAEKQSPLVKIHLETKYKDNWSFFIRYSNTGVFGDPRTPSEDYSRLLIASLENMHQINNAIIIQNQISVIGQSVTEIPLHNTEYQYRGEYSRNTYSENDLNYKLIIKNAPESRLQYALGGEYRFSALRSAWDVPWSEFRLQEKNTFLSDSSSLWIERDSTGNIVFPTSFEIMDGGWNTHMFSAFCELNYELTDKINFLASARLDKHSWTKPMFSPRLAVMYNPNHFHNIKLFYQRSLRMLTIPILYLSKENGEPVDPEIVSSFEAGYQYVKRNVWLGINMYYNNVYVVGYTGNGYSTSNIGEVDIAGVEIFGKAEFNKITIGANHSFTKQLDFEMEKSLQTGNYRQGISYADYYFTNFNYEDTQSFDFMLSGYGNDLNNWANNQTKIYTNYIFKNHLQFHVNTQLLYGMPGSKNVLKVYEQAYQRVDLTNLTPEQLSFYDERNAEFETIKQEVEDSRAYDFQIRLNGSFVYQLPIKNMDSFLGLYFQNIPITGKSKRPAYSTGSSEFYPNRLRYTVEPFSIGFRLSCSIGGE